MIRLNKWHTYLYTMDLFLPSSELALSVILGTIRPPSLHCPSFLGRHYPHRTCIVGHSVDVFLEFHDSDPPGSSSKARRLPSCNLYCMPQVWQWSIWGQRRIVIMFWVVFLLDKSGWCLPESHPCCSPEPTRPKVLLMGGLLTRFKHRRPSVCSLLQHVPTENDAACGHLKPNVYINETPLCTT